MLPNLKQTILGGVAAFCLTASASLVAPATATAGPLSIAPVSEVALPKATESVRYRRGVRRGPVRYVRHGGYRRGYYRRHGVGPAAVLGLFGAALGAVTAGSYYNGYPYGGYYPAYSYPSYYPAYSYPAYPAYYGGGYYPAYYGGYYPRYRRAYYPRVRAYRVNRPAFYRGGYARGPVYRGGGRFVGRPAMVRSVGMRGGRGRR